MDTKPTDAGKLKKGSTVVFDGKACVVRSVQLSKPGKHGSKKARIEAVAIIDNQKIIKVMPAADRVDTPIITKHSAQVLSTSGNKCNVMDLESFETFDLNIPEEFKDQIHEGTQIKYWTMLGARIIQEVNK